MSAHGPSRTALPRLTDRLPLGHAAALAVSPACLGMVSAPETVRSAFESGINFFFVTADMHWPLYEELRRGLHGLLADGVAKREEIVVAAVSYVAQPEFEWAPLEELLAAVPALEYLDVLVVGGAYGTDVDARLERRREQIARGYLGARAAGVTLHDRQAAIHLTNGEKVDIAYVRYNPSHAGARDDLFPHLKTGRSLLFNFKSVGEPITESDRQRLGLDPRYWLPEASDYYRFALSRCEVDGVLCAPSTPSEIAMLRDALARGPLSDDESEHLVRLADLSNGRKRLRR